MIRHMVLALAAVLLLLTGCYNFDYTGQYFEPIPEGEVVKFYHAPAEVPAGVYRVIGRAEIFALTGQLDSYDVEDILLDKARKCGADAVALVTSRMQKKGFYHRDMTTITQFSGGEIKAGKGKLEDNSTADINRFKSAPEITSERNYQEVLAVQALFYKRQSVLNELMTEPVGDLATFTGNTSEDDPEVENPKVQEQEAPATEEETSETSASGEPETAVAGTEETRAETSAAEEPETAAAGTEAL